MAGGVVETKARATVSGSWEAMAREEAATKRKRREVVFSKISGKQAASRCSLGCSLDQLMARLTSIRPSWPAKPPGNPPKSQEEKGQVQTIATDIEPSFVASLAQALNHAQVPCVLWRPCLLNLHGVPSIINGGS